MIHSLPILLYLCIPLIILYTISINNRNIGPVVTDDAAKHHVGIQTAKFVCAQLNRASRLCREGFRLKRGMSWLKKKLVP